MDPVISRPGDGERFERENRTITIRVDLPGLSVLEIEFAETFKVDPHTHDDHVDSFYVLDGEAEFRVGEDVFRAGPGSFVAAPIGVVHGFRNVGGTELRMVNMHVPNTGFAVRLRAG